MTLASLRFLVILLAITISSDAQAVTLPRGKEATGIVENVDSSNQMITILLDATSKAPAQRVEIKWTQRTMGTVAGKRVTLQDLQPGTRVTVRYVSPLFGPRVLRRISWCGPNTKP